MCAKLPIYFPLCHPPLVADGWLVYVVRILDTWTEHARDAVDTDDVGLWD